MIDGREVRVALDAACAAMDAALTYIEELNHEHNDPAPADDGCACGYCQLSRAKDALYALLVKMDRQRHAIENTGKKDTVADDDEPQARWGEKEVP